MDKTTSLPPQAFDVLINKATELPFSGAYNQQTEQGSYLCRRCGLGLFRSDAKFLSSCGWPSFDDEISHAIKRLPDPDGRRTEIRCQRCDAHLGHVFHGEGLTAKNLRHCVNSLAIDFVKSSTIVDSEEAIVAGGCFWGIEYYLKRLPGVVKTEVGYIGDTAVNPTYQSVCRGTTQFLEGVRIIYDKRLINYQSVIKHFFEVHDPTQTNGQGPDIGHQYLSAVFCFNEAQRLIVQQLIDELTAQGLKVATKIKPMLPFWPAETSHQDYYDKKESTPYCHKPTKRFK